MIRPVTVALAVLALAGTAQAGQSLVGSINAKLARYVHPTGRCGPGKEQLATMYGNGDGLLGKPVSCGGVLDGHTPTVAHRSLPCGTRVSLTNPHNGRSITATVRDRGPFTIAKWDLSPAVYRALDMNTSIYICVNETVAGSN